jgi:hypothetical protein
MFSPPRYLLLRTNAMGIGITNTFALIHADSWTFKNFLCLGSYITMIRPMTWSLRGRLPLFEGF